MANVRGMATRDWRRFSVSGFNLDITLSAPSPSTENATIKGIGANISGHFETDGQDVIGPYIKITFSEAELLAANANYPVRDSQGFVDLFRHRVQFLDSNNTMQNYRVRNTLPDNTVGVIICECENSNG